MKCLTVRQPWADLIVQGYKDIENRTWRTDYRGPLLIHAAAKFNREDVADTQRWFCKNKLGRYPGVPVTGAIVGIVDLVDVVATHDSVWFDGPYGWVLANPREAIEPLPYKGRLGLYDVPDELVEEEE